MTARVTRIFLKRNNKRGIRPVFYFAYSLPCYCEAVRSTLKTLAYDCGNPVQYVCGHSPAVLFYLLDRHALLAMTMGSNGIFLNALTTPTLRVTPPMEGNLVHTVVEQSSPLRRGGRHRAPRDLSRGWLARGGFYTPPPHGAVGIICTLHSIL